MVTDPDTNEVGPERTYGCLPPEESGLMQCRGSLVPHLNPANISCCSDEDLCNRDLVRKTIVKLKSW
jgi:bone morphogenetic protein receptor type-1B